MTTPTAANTILALDLGKYKSVACLDTGSPDTTRFWDMDCQVAVAPATFVTRSGQFGEAAR